MFVSVCHTTSLQSPSLFACCLHRAPAPLA
jgi:hypothetical protein